VPRSPLRTPAKGQPEVISIEAARDGFVLTVGGHRVLSHSLRTPCIGVGRTEPAAKRGGPSSPPRRRRGSFSYLRSFKVSENSPSFAAIDFEGRLRMEIKLEDDRIRISFSRFDPGLDVLRLRIQAYPDERIYGLGERPAPLDLKGSRVPLWAEERGALLERDGRHAFQSRKRYLEASSPFPLPRFVSSKNYWCEVDTPAFSVFDFSRRSLTSLEFMAIPREIVIGVRASAPALLFDMSATVGRQRSLPEWAFDGAWLGVEDSGEERRGKIEAALNSGVKIAAVWLQGPGPKKGGRGSRAEAPRRESGLELAAEVKHWRERGIRFLGRLSALFPSGSELFREAKAGGFLVRNSEGGDYLLQAASGPAALLDLTNPKAAAWMASVIGRDLLDLGMSGWLADIGLSLPTDCVLSSGADPRLERQRWPQRWAELNLAVLEASGRKDELLFAARSGSGRAACLVPIFWSSFRHGSGSRGGAGEELSSSVPAALSLGLSGVGFWHSVVGGGRSRSARGRDCLFRGMEMAAFSPFFRIQECGLSEGGSGLYGDPSCLAELARMSDIYSALKPYHLAAAEEYLKEGLPLLRHPYIHYEGEAELHRRDYQYLYGRDLLVAPPLGPRRELTELYLPRDSWIHLWSSRRFAGGALTVDSPQGCPAVFYRASSPFAPLFDSIRRTAHRL
jgi:sulfoquinovosidase